MAEEARRVVALYDIHLPDNINLDGVIRYIRDFKPTHLILGGDFMHLESVRELAKSKGFDAKSFEFSGSVDGLQADFALGNTILDQLDAACPPGCSKTFLEGNHEYWLAEIVEKAPALRKIFDPRDNLKLGSRKYSWVPMNKSCNVGRAWFIHGVFCNQYHANKHLRIYGRNLFYGHVHTHQVHTYSSPIDDEAKSATAVWCLCKPGAYLKGQPNAWGNGFLTMYSDPKTNFFWPYVIPIINGKFIAPNGKEY